MSKKTRMLFLVVEVILFILLVLFLNDNIASIIPVKIAPFIILLMFIVPIVALIKSKNQHIDNDNNQEENK